MSDNPYLRHGEQNAPAPRKPANSAKPMPGTLDRALQDRQKLMKAYRRERKVAFEALCATPYHGAKLREFALMIRRFTIRDAEALIRFCSGPPNTWLRLAPDDIRFAAFDLVAEHITRLRVRAGMVPFDDPLPGHDDDVFQTVKKEMAL